MGLICGKSSKTWHTIQKNIQSFSEKITIYCIFAFTKTKRGSNNKNDKIEFNIKDKYYTPYACSILLPYIFYPTYITKL